MRYSKSKYLQKIIATMVSVMMIMSLIPAVALAVPTETFDVNFGSGSWTIDEVTVTAQINGSDVSGVQNIGVYDSIVLSNFNSETMEVKITATDGFTTYLMVDDGTTALSSLPVNVGLPYGQSLTFSVQAKPDESTPPGPGGNDDYSVNFEGASWTIGETTVTASVEGMDLTSGSVTIQDNTVITLTNFDPETMDAKVVAEDGFNTTLTVVEGSTSLSARPVGVGLPFGQSLTFSVVSKSDNPNPPQDGNVLKFQFDNRDGADVTVMVTFDNTSECFFITADEVDEGGNGYITIPNGATTVTVTVDPGQSEGTEPYVLNPGASRLYVDDENIMSDEIAEAMMSNSGYTRNLSPDGNSIVFVIACGFADVSWYTVSWGGGNVQVENGIVIVDSIVIGDNIYINGLEAADPENNAYPLSSLSGTDNNQALRNVGVNLPAPDEMNYRDELAIDYTDLFIRMDYNPGITINFLFIPDYGYQVTDVITNETDSILDDFAPGTEISTFAFEVQTNSNVHFIVEFSSADNVVENNADGVTEGYINNGSNVIDSGNLRLTIDSASEETVSDEVAAEVGDNSANYLDLNLYQEVSKGGDNGTWEEELSELPDFLNITLEIEGLDENSEYYIVREHEFEDGSTVVERVDVYVDYENSLIVFDTDLFSTYVLVEVQQETEPAGVEMYRLYNPNSGEHFYTGSVAERDFLVTAGWRYEGVAWTAPTTGTPVYRVYNPYTGDHHYTTNYSEVEMLVNAGWRYEGIGWYSAGNTGNPLYRLYNPYCRGAGSHHYTTSAAERDNLTSLGWRYEGIGWYGN